ncbi:MAG: DUF4926 domain-containing protein [Chroococcidiopsidaceae cyanobacterium CP_BM_RX_35]|nr:DUF4926 domain-containing protein [Chroococcidiopsidaceae cyanobacterium CP_BM_RX_35]
MTTTIELLAVVALTVNLPSYNLWHGQVGTVVEVLAGGTAFEVEFSDRNERTYESVSLRPDQVMVLCFDPVSPDSTPERKCHCLQSLSSSINSGKYPNSSLMPKGEL